MLWSFFFHGQDADSGLRKARNRGCEIMHTHYFTAPVFTSQTRRPHKAQSTQLQNQVHTAFVS
jgi:hypothetical protein